MTLRQARERTGLSVSEAARRLKVTRGAVSQWELGISMPSVERVGRLAELYGCTAGEIVEGLLKEVKR